MKNLKNYYKALRVSFMYPVVILIITLTAAVILLQWAGSVLSGFSKAKVDLVESMCDLVADTKSAFRDISKAIKEVLV